MHTFIFRTNNEIFLTAQKLSLSKKQLCYLKEISEFFSAQYTVGYANSGYCPFFLKNSERIANIFCQGQNACEGIVRLCVAMS